MTLWRAPVLVEEFSQSDNITDRRYLCVGHALQLLLDIPHLLICGVSVLLTMYAILKTVMWYFEEGDVVL